MVGQVCCAAAQPGTGQVGNQESYEENQPWSGCGTVRRLGTPAQRPAASHRMVQKSPEPPVRKSK